LGLINTGIPQASSSEPFTATSSTSVTNSTYSSTPGATGLYYFNEVENIYLLKLTTYTETIKTPCVTNSSQLITYQLQDCAGNINTMPWINFDDSTSQITGTTIDVSAKTPYQV
jgi:hypothetical protein